VFNDHRFRAVSRWLADSFDERRAWNTEAGNIRDPVDGTDTFVCSGRVARWGNLELSRFGL